jgi:predicted nuclease of predicted toxin-antitoxin system
VNLLFDENLSRRLPQLLASTFPDATHVSLQGLGSSDDHAVWGYAQSRDWTIVTKDYDFVPLALTRGSPPKVIVLAIGNCTTIQVAALLEASQAQIAAFQQSTESVLVLGQGAARARS